MQTQYSCGFARLANGFESRQKLSETQYLCGFAGTIKQSVTASVTANDLKR